MFWTSPSNGHLELYRDTGENIIATIVSHDEGDPLGIVEDITNVFKEIIASIRSDKCRFGFEDAMAIIEGFGQDLTGACDHLRTMHSEGEIQECDDTPRSIECMMCKMLAVVALYVYTGEGPKAMGTNYIVPETTPVKLQCSIEGMTNDMVQDTVLESIISSNYNRYVKTSISRSISFRKALPFMEHGVPPLASSIISDILIDDGHSDSRLSTISTMFLKPDPRTSFLSSMDGDHIAAGCSFSGIKHLKSGGECEDFCGFHNSYNLTAMAVADGVSGSGSKTAIGSKCAVQSFFTLMEKYKTSLGQNSDYSSIRKVFMDSFIVDFYGLWVDCLKDHEDDDGISPGDYTTTFLGLTRIGDWAVLYKIGNGLFIINGGISASSSISIDDNCTEPLITASMFKSPTNPDYWKMMILPSEDVRSVLMCSDGADTLLTGETTRYHGFLNNCPQSQPNYIRAIDDWSKIDDSKQLYNEIMRTTSDLSVAPAMFGGDPVNGDDISVAFISFRGK